ncbi:MAG: M20 family metallopeptidase [Anaerolineae bacterium]
MTIENPITPEEIMQRANAMQEQITTWRRTIHVTPELSFTEVQTARLVQSVLHELGIEAETGVGKTGVVGHIEGSGPVVGLRADMDALPIQEENGSDFDSQVAGIMHACGHDAHTAILMGAATILKGFADEGRLPGSVRLLFQPSEENSDAEGKSGAVRMIEDGALKGLDAVFGLHVDSETEVGKMSTRAGGLLAAGDGVEITVRGTGGHAAFPHRANDPTVLTAHLLLAIQNIVSRRVDPLETAVITIGTMHGGTASNVIPEEIKLTGTMRSMTPETRELLSKELRRACKVVEALGGEVDLTIHQRGTPTVNDADAAAVAFDGLRNVLGSDQVFERQPIMAGEDFAAMLQEVPGAFMMLGVHNPEWKQEYRVHTPTFRMDERALAIGAAGLVSTAIEWMHQKGKSA